MLSTWTAGRVATTGFRCSKTRRQLWEQPTGRTAIHRRTVGGTVVSLMRTSGAYDTHPPASEIDPALISTSTPAKWQQVQALVFSISVYLLYVGLHYIRLSSSGQ